MKKNTLMRPAVTNYYYLVVGILSIFFAFTHAKNGRANVLPVADKSDLDVPTKTTIYYVWHIITVENFIIGVSFLAMAFYRDLSKVRFAAWLTASIMVARWGVIFRSTLLRNRAELKSTVPDLVAILVYTALILLGIRKKDGHKKE